MPDLPGVVALSCNYIHLQLEKLDRWLKSRNPGKDGVYDWAWICKVLYITKNN